jgi:hypothetical protein
VPLNGGVVTVEANRQPKVTRARSVGIGAVAVANQLRCGAGVAVFVGRAPPNPDTSPPGGGCLIGPRQDVEANRENDDECNPTEEAQPKATMVLSAIVFILPPLR